MTRKNQIRLAFLFVATISLGVSLAALLYMSRMATRIEKIATVDAQMTQIAESLSTRMQEAKKLEREFVLFLDTSPLDQGIRILDAMTAEAVRARQLSEIYSAWFDSVGMSIKSYRENIQRLKEVFRENPRMFGRIRQNMIDWRWKLCNF